MDTPVNTGFLWIPKVVINDKRDRWVKAVENFVECLQLITETSLNTKHVIDESRPGTNTRNDWGVLKDGNFKVIHEHIGNQKTREAFPFGGRLETGIFTLYTRIHFLKDTD